MSYVNQDGQPGDEKFVIKVPGPDSPGFFYRTRTALELSSRMEGDDTEDRMEAFEEMIDFTLQYVTEPEDRDKARALLSGPNGISLNQFKAIFGTGTEGNKPSKKK